MSKFGSFTGAIGTASNIYYVGDGYSGSDKFFIANMDINSNNNPCIKFSSSD